MKLIKKFLKEMIFLIGIKYIIYYLLFLIACYIMFSLQPFFIAKIYYNNKISYIYVCFFIFSFLSISILNYPNNQLLQKIRKCSKQVIWNNNKNKNYSFLSNINVGEFQNLIQEISFSSRSLQYESLQSMLKSIIVLLIYTFLLSKFNIILGFLYIFLYLTYIWISVFFLSGNKKEIRDVLNSSSAVNSFTIDFFRNIDTIFSKQTIELENENYKNLLLNEENKYFQLQRKIDNSHFILQFFITFITVFLFILSVNINKKNIDNSIIFILVYSIFNLNDFGKNFLAMLEHKDRLEYSLNKIGYFDENCKNHIFPLENMNSDTIVKFENVSFSYNIDEKNIKETFIINYLNLNIKNKEKILISGNNGTGKSTLAKLISNLLINQNGIIKYNYQYIQNSTDIVYYSQNMNLFDRTILENIIYPNKDFDLIKIKKLIKILNLDTLIKTENDLFQKKPGDFGKNFSGGEKQKILIIRSMLNPKPLIIYDEINSALDSKSLKAFYKLLSICLNNSTIILISHRQENINSFSKIIYLN